MTPEEARRIRARMEAIPAGSRNTIEDPYWVRSAVRYWTQRREEAARQLVELEPAFQRYAREGFYEGFEEREGDLT